jgi:hypothetical protein
MEPYLNLSRDRRRISFKKYTNIDFKCIVLPFELLDSENRNKIFELNPEYIYIISKMTIAKNLSKSKDFEFGPKLNKITIKGLMRTLLSPDSVQQQIDKKFLDVFWMNFHQIITPMRLFLFLASYYVYSNAIVSAKDS